MNTEARNCRKIILAFFEAHKEVRLRVDGVKSIPTADLMELLYEYIQQFGTGWKHEVRGLKIPATGGYRSKNKEFEFAEP